MILDPYPLAITCALITLAQFILVIFILMIDQKKSDLLIRQIQSFRIELENQDERIKRRVNATFSNKYVIKKLKQKGSSTQAGEA